MKKLLIIAGLLWLFVPFHSIAQNNGRASLKSRIEKQMTSPTGPHKKLEEYVLKNLFFPASYEHIKTTYKMPSKPTAITAIFTMRFLANSARNEKLLNTLVAECRISDGELVKAISWKVGAD